MTSESVAFLTMIGTWANAIAMGGAAVFAALAWREQKSYSRYEKDRYRRAQAVAHTQVAISDLSTGDVALARDAVDAWTIDFEGSLPSSTEPGHAETIRGDWLTGRHANMELRQQVFVLLLALQRLAPLAEELKESTPAQRSILRMQIQLSIDVLQRFADRLDDDECKLFRDIASAASESVVLVAEHLDPDIDLALTWSSALSGFSLELVHK